MVKRKINLAKEKTTEKIKQACSTCRFYNDITSIVGYCSTMAIIIDNGVVILDTKEIIKEMKRDDQIMYEFPIVNAFFGCINYELDERITIL